MTAYEIYNHIYKRLNNVTPINADCGQLCNKACCKGDENTGMYLFPHEEVMLKGDNFSIKETNGKKLCICNGSCDRNSRPLSCRIFPLIPYIGKDGKFSVIFDHRAKGVCPIAYANVFENLDPEFIKRVREASALLIKFKDIKNFIYEISRECDEYKNYFTL